MKMQKAGHNTPTVNSAKEPNYLKSTAESRNKQRIKNEDNGGQKKNKFPLKIQRLCEENILPTNRNYQKDFNKRLYCPHYYDEQEQKPCRENEKYLGTVVQDDVFNSFDYKPTPPVGRPTSTKSRKLRLAPPETPEKYEEYREKAERLVYRSKEHTCNTLIAENAKVKYLQTELDDKNEDLNRVNEKLFKWSLYVTELEKELRNLKDSNVQQNSVRNENLYLKKELTAMKERAESLHEAVRTLQREKSDFELKISNFTIALQERDIKIESLVKHRESVSVLSEKYANLIKEKENAENLVRRMSRNVRNKESEISSLTAQLKQSDERNFDLKNEMNSLQQSNRQSIDASLQQLSTENLSLKKALANRKAEIEKLCLECEIQRQSREKVEHEMTELNQKKKKEIEDIMILFEKKIFEETNARIQDLTKEVRILNEEKYIKNNKIKTLLRDLDDKEKEIKSLNESLLQSRERVSMLSDMIKGIKESRKQTVDVNVMLIKNENDSLKSDLEDTRQKLEESSKKCSALHRDNEEAITKISILNDSLHEKERENEFLTDKLDRSETQMSVLNSKIEDMQRMSKTAVDKSKSIFQNENASLKSAYDHAATKYKDLSKELTSVKQDKVNAENEISSLSKALHNKEKELESLKNKLARSEKNISILSKDIKDIQASKRKVDEEKLQGLQTENDSLKSALSEATNNIEVLLNKGTNLQKYKTDAEHKTSKLMDALQEKETEIDALSKELARSEEKVSILLKDIKDIRESKHQVADEKHRNLQKENASLKSELAEATKKIDDLWNKCTNLQKYRSDTEHEIRTLLNAVEEKDTEIETLHEHLARSEKNVSILSKDIKDIQGSKRQADDKNVQSLKTENASLKSELAEATTEIDALWKKCTNLEKYKTDTEHTIKTLLNDVKEKETEFETLNKQLARKNNELSKDVSNLKKDKENAENQRNSFSKALDEKEKDMELMQKEIARYKEKISTLTKYVEDIQGSKNQAADESIKGFQKKIDSLESDLRSATTKMNDLSHKYKHLQKDKESAEHTINKLSKTVQERDKEIDSLVEELAMANENGNKAEQIASAGIIQKLKEDNATLKSDLVKQKQETDKKVSDLTKEIQKLQKSKGTSSDEYNARKLYEENEFLKAQLDRTSRSYEQLRKDYNEVKREKDHALNRLSSVAGEKLRNNNPGIADLSDENRPINLGEKFSQLYDDQWTDAIEHLEEMDYSETEGIRCLLDILKAVFDECVKLSDIHFNQLKELTGTSHLPSDQLKKLKDLRKATAIHSVAKIKQVVNDYMSTAFSKEKAACQTYIDRSIELCWLMSVQDPPVVIDFIAVHGQAIDDKILRKFTKTGSKIDFLVWPVIRLHKNGPLLQKGVVQPI